MSLTQWQANGWLKPHTTSGKEISRLLAIVRRDLADARARVISDDWRFGIAYNAALKLVPSSSMRKDSDRQPSWHTTGRFRHCR